MRREVSSMRAIRDAGIVTGVKSRRSRRSKWHACLRDEIEHMESRDVRSNRRGESSRAKGCEKNGTEKRDERKEERRENRMERVCGRVCGTTGGEFESGKTKGGRDCDQSHLLHCPGN